MLFNPVFSVVTRGVVETGAFINRLAERRGMFGRARLRSKETGKPLVVVGAPTSGVVRGSASQYKCGDLPCVDVRGCAACGAEPRDLTVVGAIPVPDGGAVVVCQYVLEYVDDIDLAWAEVMRAAGNSNDVFVAYRSQTTLSHISTGSRRRIVSAPPNVDGKLLYRQFRRPPKTMIKGGGT